MTPDLKLRQRVAELRGWTNLLVGPWSISGTPPGGVTCQAPRWECDLGDAGHLWQEMSEWAAVNGDHLLLGERPDEDKRNRRFVHAQFPTRSLVPVRVYFDQFPKSTPQELMARAIAVLYVAFKEGLA